jgi:hypothetical protein
MDINVVVGLSWGDAARVMRSRGVLVKNVTVRVERAEGKRVWLLGDVRVKRVDGRRV